MRGFELQRNGQRPMRTLGGLPELSLEDGVQPVKLRRPLFSQSRRALLALLLQKSRRKAGIALSVGDHGGRVRQLLSVVFVTDAQIRS